MSIPETGLDIPDPELLQTVHPVYSPELDLIKNTELASKFLIECSSKLCLYYQQHLRKTSHLNRPLLLELQFIEI